jgi:hypothetical protein
VPLTYFPNTNLVFKMSPKEIKQAQAVTVSLQELVDGTVPEFLEAKKKSPRRKGFNFDRS